MYQLVIGNTVKVPVKFETNNNGKGKAFNFNLICDRMSQDDLTNLEGDKKETVIAVLKKITTGWENQTLVLDGDNKPAEFSEAAFDAMLSLAGICHVAWGSYLTEVGAKVKN